MKRTHSPRFLLAILIVFGSTFCGAAQAKILNIVAAENFYGALAEQLGGPYVHVTTILNNPNQDPHLFSAKPSTARALADADIVVYNGLMYDPWMEKLLSASQHKPAQIIVVAQLLHRKSGDNPHIWYDPATLPLSAIALEQALAQDEPLKQNYFLQQLQQFEQRYQPLSTQIAQLKQQYQGTPVIATEPLFNDMARTLGLQMRSVDFQLNIMNDTTPSPTQILTFENYLRNHAVRVLIYNAQVSNPTTLRMQTIARQAGIPIIGVSETQPVGKTYVTWMQDQLNTLQHALAQKSPP